MKLSGKKDSNLTPLYFSYVPWHFNLLTYYSIELFVLLIVIICLFPQILPQVECKPQDGAFCLFCALIPPMPAE